MSLTAKEATKSPTMSGKLGNLATQDERKAGGLKLTKRQLTAKRADIVYRVVQQILDEGALLPDSIKISRLESVARREFDRDLELQHSKGYAWASPRVRWRMRKAVIRCLALAAIKTAQSTKGLRARFDQLIARIDQRVKALVEANPDRKQHVTHLRTIDGVGPVVSAALVNTLERTPLNSADAFVAFTGLDPRPDDSGQHRGKRRLSKRGPAELRRLLYVAAMSAKKTKAWKPLFEQYRSKGLSSTAALVILARRIARTAWSMYTYKTEFDPARLTKSLT